MMFVGYIPVNTCQSLVVFLISRKTFIRASIIPKLTSSKLLHCLKIGKSST